MSNQDSEDIATCTNKFSTYAQLNSVKISNHCRDDKVQEGYCLIPLQ